MTTERDNNQRVSEWPIVFIKWLVVLIALLWTTAAAGSMALIAMNSWGIPCPRPVWTSVMQILVAPTTWTAALSFPQGKETND